MTIHAGTQWEVRTTGSDTNGGGFSPTIASAGTDYSQQDTPQLSITDGVCTGNTTLTSATGGFTSAMIGNVVYMSSGPTWRTISAVINTNTVTLAGNGPNATGMTCNVGGCLATPGRLSNLPVSNNRCWIKEGVYTITTATPGPSGPYYQSTNIQVVVEGYSTSRGDLSGDVVLSAGAVGSVTLWRMACTNQKSTFRNVQADANGQSSVVGFVYNSTQLLMVFRCVATGCSTGFNATGYEYCVAVNCTTGFSGGSAFLCIATGGTTGFTVNTAVECLAIGCAGGFSNLDFANGCHLRCLAVSCTSSGYAQDAGALSRRQTLRFCGAHSCGTGFSIQYSTTNLPASSYDQCWTYNCTTPVAGSAEWQEFLTVVDDPFTDVSGGDYTLTSAGAAALEITPWLLRTWKSYASAVPPAAGSGGSTVIVIED